MSGTARHDREMQMNIQGQLNATKDPLEKIRLQCLQRGVSGIKTFARSFKIFDDNADHQLTLSELTKGLSDYGVHLDQHEIETVFNTFDKDHSGFINFDEFMIALRPKMSANRVKLIEIAFRKLDKSGDGVIGVEDLKGVYNVRHHPLYQNGEKTEEEIFQLFLTNFDSPSDGDGKIDYQEFENYYSCVSASIDHDVYFDLMMRNAWKI
ncbi:hypothetical protein CHUAL_006223 [Chamberlinius hualienensis]